MFDKAKLKNYALWIAVVAFIPMIVSALGDYDIFIQLPGNYDKLCVAFLGILVFLGIINNPSNGKGFKG